MEEERSNTIKAITSPLGFFALSLLIVEGFLGIVLVFSKSDLSESFYFWGMIIGASLFLIVVILVWLLVMFDPRKLLYRAEDYNKENDILLEGDEYTTQDINIFDKYNAKDYANITINKNIDNN